MNEDQRQLQKEARQLTRCLSQTALATIDRETGEPYASLAMVAQDYDASPILFISRLSDHRKNLDQDGRISLLFDATHNTQPRLEGARVSLQGKAEESEVAHLRRRFIARHQDAADYAKFADFGIYRVEVSRAHFAAGFGRSHWLSSEGLVLDEIDIEDWCTAEQPLIDAIAKMNGDALKTAFNTSSTPMITGVDPDGIDLRDGDATYRFNLQQPHANPDQLAAAIRQGLEAERAN